MAAERQSGILCSAFAKIAGAVLVLAGALVLIFTVPGWFWGLIIGAALIAGGIFTFRNCG
ncbi:MAG: hypothetical protein IJC48_06380 [Clostridia bacterium]|nr:hypothetical protein [Clostridia bacterium]